MSCQNNNECKTQQCRPQPRTNNNGYICIIVLYILLAIIIGSIIY